jgi:hypothetical protein
MPRAWGRAGLRQGKQRGPPRTGPGAITRRYAIEVKDAATGAALIRVVADWTAFQKGAAVALIAELAGGRDGKRRRGTDADKPATGKPPHD